jgi:putative transposase
MSNHVHYVVHDADGRLPEFTTWLHAMVARAVNSIRKRSGTFWEREQVNQPVLADKDTVLDKIAYTLANPTRAGLVPHGHQWIGARSRPDEYGKTRVLKRPAIALFQDGTLPESVTMRLEVPPMYENVSPVRFSEMVNAATEAKEKAARESMRDSGREFAGVDSLRALSWTKRANRPERKGRGRDLKPTVLAACANLKRGLLEQLASFRTAYRRTMEKLRAGFRDLEFPDGAWLMPKRLGKAVAADGTMPGGVYGTLAKQRQTVDLTTRCELSHAMQS